MSLVAYGSSDESDSEETSTSAAAERKPSGGSLFSVLPAPKASGSAETQEGQKPAAADSRSREDLVDPQPSAGRSFLSSLPKPKKRTEPVKITAPQVQRHDVSQLIPLIILLYYYCRI